MQSNDVGIYQGDIYYDTLRDFIDGNDLPRTWARIAGELGFATVSEASYWNKDQGGVWRMGHFYRLFLILVRSGIEQLADVEAMLTDKPEHRRALQMLQSDFLVRGIIFYAIPYDILALLVLHTLGTRAKLELGVYAWRDEIHVALKEIIAKGKA